MIVIADAVVEDEGFHRKQISDELESPGPSLGYMAGKTAAGAASEMPSLG